MKKILTISEIIELVGENEYMMIIENHKETLNSLKESNTKNDKIFYSLDYYDIDESSNQKLITEATLRIINENNVEFNLGNTILTDDINVFLDLSNNAKKLLNGESKFINY